MKTLESKRLILRSLEPEDFNDFWDLSKNWKTAPGPEFDKWPVSEAESRDFFNYCIKNSENSLWIYLREEKRIIGGIFLNGVDKNGWMDMGHVIHSDYQNNDTDKEAFTLFINHVFEIMEVKAIITNNDPDKKQNAPLYSLGFTDRNSNGGQLIMEKNNWNKNFGYENFY